MKFKSAVEILKEANYRLIREFLGDSIDQDDMELKYLKYVIPNFDKREDLLPNSWSPSPNELSGTKQTGEPDLISLRPDVLERHGLTLKEFEKRLKPYGWTVTGYTDKQLLIMPNRLGRVKEKDFPQPKKKDNLAIIEKCKGLYLRFDNRDPATIKRVGFRSTKNRYLDLENPKRSRNQYWNQERVYVFSLEELAKVTKGDPLNVLYGLFTLVQSGMEYGRYLYLMKVPSSVRFDRDLEYAKGNLKYIAGYLESSVHSSMIMKSYDTYSEEAGKDLVKYIGIDRFVKNKSIIDKLSSNQAKNSDERVKYRSNDRNSDIEQWD